MKKAFLPPPFLQFVILIILLVSISNHSFAQLKVLSNGSTQGGGSKGQLRLETTEGYVDIGPQNTLWSHFITDINNFYFNRSIYLGNGALEAYRSYPLTLRTGNSSYDNPYRVYISTSGNVGIGYYYIPSASYRLDVDGDIRTTGDLYENSDSRLKKDIKDLKKDKVDKLYDLKAKTYVKEKRPRPEISIALSDTARIPMPEEPEDTTTHIGFIAQELQLSFPELVKEDTAGYLSVNYTSLIPVLVEALKEQKSALEELQKQIDKTSLKSAETDNMIIDSEEPGATEAILGQNQPNPFNQNTTIAYFLPSTIQKAVFYIYDMNGKQLKSMGIAERENGSITIHANELNPGMYYYTLIADGQIIGTKQMILTD